MKSYEVEMEIAGLYACNSSPDSGDMARSGVVPSKFQSGRIFSSIADVQNAVIVPTSVEICAPIQYHRIVCNYNGVLRHQVNRKAGNAEQHVVYVLFDVRYVLHGKCVPHSPPMNRVSEKGKFYFSPGQNGAHSLQEQFDRRLKQGQCFHTPFLGRKEFTPSYFGPRRPDTRPCEDINMTLVSMPDMTFSDFKYGTFKPTFRQNVEVKNGVLFYA